jgi:hypothetical protein
MIAAFLCLSANAASAAPKKRWYEKGPLGETERSIGCMVQPWKDWKCAGLHYVIFGADFFDYKSTQYGFHNCASCTESNPLFGSGRPSPVRMFGLGTGLSLLTEHALTQYAHERGPRKGLVVTGIFVGIHTDLGIRQYGIPADSTVRTSSNCTVCGAVR